MYSTTAPTKPGFYPIIWPRANLILVAHIPEGFDTKSPVISTTTWGSVWSIDEMTRNGVLWGDRLDIEAHAGASFSKVRSRVAKEDRTDNELDQTPVIETPVVVEKKKRAPRPQKKKKDTEVSLDELL